MRSIFKSGISLFSGVLFWGVIVFLLLLFLLDFYFNNLSLTIYFHLFDALVIAFLLWMWLGTKYIIDGNHLICKSGPFNRNIDISEIKKVVLDQKIWAGFRPALSFKGMVIYHNKFDEIFISPNDREGFLSVITRMNPTIKVEKN